MVTEGQVCSQAGVLTGKEGVHVDMEPGAGEVSGSLQGQDFGVLMWSAYRTGFVPPWSTQGAQLVWECSPSGQEHDVAAQIRHASGSLLCCTWYGAPLRLQTAPLPAPASSECAPLSGLAFSARS